MDAINNILLSDVKTVCNKTLAPFALSLGFEYF